MVKIILHKTKKYFDLDPALTLEKIVSFCFEGVGLLNLFGIIVLLRGSGWSDWLGWRWP